MLTGIHQSAVLLIVLTAYYIADFIFISVYDRRRDIDTDKSGRNWSYTIMALIAGILVVLQPWLLPQLSLHIDGGLGIAMQLTGIVTIVLSLALQWWSRFHLRHFYSERVQVLDGHRLVDTGPYHFVRHPIFTSFFLLTAGMMLINPSLPMLALALYVYWDFVTAAKREEVLLSECVPGYVEYMARTSRFFPSVGMIRQAKTDSEV